MVKNNNVWLIAFVLIGGLVAGLIGGAIGSGITGDLFKDTTNGSSYQVTLKSDNPGPRIEFGTKTASDKYMKIGAYGNVNNIDLKGRNLKIFGANIVNISGDLAANHIYTGNMYTKAEIDSKIKPVIGQNCRGALPDSYGDAQSQYLSLQCDSSEILLNYQFTCLTGSVLESTFYGGRCVNNDCSRYTLNSVGASCINEIGVRSSPSGWGMCCQIENLNLDTQKSAVKMRNVDKTGKVTIK